MHMMTTILGGILGMGCGQNTESSNSQLASNSTNSDIVATVAAQPVVEEQPKSNAFALPTEEDLSEQPNATQIRRGRELVMNTKQLLPNNVGDQLKCTNCHLQGGTVPNAMTFVGVVDRFPQYRSRSATTESLAYRVNSCFERSMNGVALEEQSQEMQDIIAYMTWVSSKVADGKNLHEKGVKKLEPLEPNLENGASVYAQKCASCHQMTGQGVVVENNIIYPPLWGEHSFNIGAGMARLDTAAAFVKWNMPFGQGGTLSDQEAYDVAAYFSQQVRPDYAKKDQDWPKGEKPRDARY